MAIFEEKLLSERKDDKFLGELSLHSFMQKVGNQFYVKVGELRSCILIRKALGQL
jgi:hypothetical protein